MLRPLLCFLFVDIAISLTEKNFTESTGTVKSDGKDGRYLNNVAIKYNIRVPNGKRVKVAFKTFNVLGSMPSCEEDSVEIFVGCDDQSKSIGKFCSCGLDCKSKLFDIYSKDECISLLLKTDNHYAGTGFEAHYSSSPKITSVSTAKLCSQLNVSQQAIGNIFSPLWPNKYFSNFTCTWTFTTPVGYNATIYFMNFRIELNRHCSQHSSIDDYVRVTGSTGSKNETIQQRLCSQQGVDKAFSVPVKNYPKVYVTFFSDGDNVTDEETGFAAGFISYKPGIGVAGDGKCTETTCTNVLASTPKPTSQVQSTSSQSSTKSSRAPLSKETSLLCVTLLVLFVNLLMQNGDI